MHGPEHLYGWRMDLDLRQLRALVAVVDEGSFTDAAIALGTSQASVSRAVAALEAALGARVLRRNTRQVSPTVVGARAVRHARRVLDEVAALRRSVESPDGRLRIGYAWAALGRHTTAVQSRWAAQHPGSELVFVHSASRAAGLTDGTADVAVVRQAPADPRIASALVGHEARVAALATGDPLARRRSLRMGDFTGRTVGLDSIAGTTTADLWPPGTAPATRSVHGIDEWLTLIAAGQAIGLTSEATAVQYPRLGVTYRPVRDAAPLPVWLTWWRDEPPPSFPDLERLVRAAYEGTG